MESRASPDHSPRAVTVFEQVLKLPMEARDAFVENLIEENPSLGAEVKSLLAAYTQDGVTEELNQALADALFPRWPDLKLGIGRQISNYEILDRLGVGGMGVVYKARDLRLNRLVALKFLAPHLSANSEAKKRFMQEARAASALDHTNICTVYEIDETDDGLVFIAMAYYEGETLKQRIDQGPLAEHEVIEIGLQMAEGLGRAHEAGIVHRDVKPANTILTLRGDVKLLDFGIAKLDGTTNLTRKGATLGTIGYMSPEQARGHDVDQQTDLWALGVVLYEMLAGRRPFDARADEAILYSILNSAPAPLVSHNPEVSRPLEKLVARLLEKKPHKRPDGMGEVVSHLRSMREETASRSLEIAVANKKRIYWILGFLGVLLLGVFFVVGKLITQPIPVEPQYQQVTFSGLARLPAISPDGQVVAYVENDAALMIKDLTRGEAVKVFEGHGFINVEWSPDGMELLVASSDALAIIPRFGGAAQYLPTNGIGTWSPDGTSIAYYALAGDKIWIYDRVSDDTNSIALQHEFDWMFGLDWAPTGDWLVIQTLINSPRRLDLLTVRSDGSVQNIIKSESIEVSSPVWDKRAEALYFFQASGDTWDLMKLPMRPRTGMPGGAARFLEGGFQIYHENGYSNLSLSKDGNKLLYERRMIHGNLFEATLGNESGELEVKQLTSGTLFHDNPILSPDGLQLAYTRNDNIFVMDLASQRSRQLSFTDTDKYYPAWSPDGKEIVFGDSQDGQESLTAVSPETGGRRTIPKTSRSSSIAWAPGDALIFARLDNRTFLKIDPVSEDTIPLIDDTKGWTFFPVYAPDKQQIAFIWNHREFRQGIWLLALEDGTTTLLHDKLALPIDWSADSKWFYFYEMDKPHIYRRPVAGGEVDTVATLPNALPQWFSHGVTMSADGSKFIYASHSTNSDIWLLENFDAE